MRKSSGSTAPAARVSVYDRRFPFALLTMTLVALAYRDSTGSDAGGYFALTVLG